MNVNDENGSVEMRCMTMPIYEGETVNEISGELVLPDYRPEIRRLLCVESTVLPPAKYVGAGSAELDGTVDCQVLYVGMDGGLYTYPLSVEYNIVLPLENLSGFDINEGVTVFTTGNIENTSARVTGPRRVAVRMRMRTHSQVYGKYPYAERVSGDASEESIQRLSRRTKNVELCGALSDVLTVSEEISGVSPEVRVIGADAKALVEETLIGSDGVTVRGYAVLKLVCTADNGRTETFNRKIPFDCLAELEAPIGEPRMCRAKCTVAEINVNVGESSILCDVSLLCECRVLVNRPLRYTADMYSTERECSCEYAEREALQLISAFNSNFSQSERIPLSSLTLQEGTSIVDSYGTAVFDKLESAGDKSVLVGESRYTLICEKDGEYSASEIAMPIRYTLPAVDGDVSSFDCSCDVVSCKIKAGGENLELDAELSVSAMLMGKESLRTLKSAELGDALKKNGGELILCYPAPDDTVWDIAKRYSVAQSSVSGDIEASPYLIIEN